jgi:hypothetical protein
MQCCHPLLRLPARFPQLAAAAGGALLDRPRPMAVFSAGVLLLRRSVHRTELPSS